MRLVSLLLHVHRAVAHILHAQGAGDHQHLVQRLAVARLQDHAAHARVERQARQLLAERCQLIGVVHRAEFGQQLVAIGNRAARRRFDEGKILHDAQPQRLHAQNHASQRAAQDLRVGEARPATEVFLVVQPDADAISHAAASARALVGGGLADRLDQQLLHLAAKTVALDPRRARVNHVADARYGERGLGNIGGQDDAPAGVAVKNTVLLGLGEACEQRQHLGVAGERLVRQVLAQVVGSLADFAFAGQKNQNVAGGISKPKFIHRVGNGVVQVVFARLFKRPPALLHREHAARDQNDGCWPVRRGEMPRKPVRINSRRCHHHLQIRPARQDLAQVAQQKIDVQAALVRLVDDDGVVGF